MKVERLEIDHDVPVPVGKGQIQDELDIFISNMKPKDSVRFKNYADLTNFVNKARRYSRKYQANKWMFSTTAKGEYRVWRTE